MSQDETKQKKTLKRKFIQINSDGFFQWNDGTVLDDQQLGRQWLEDLTIDSHGICHLIFENEDIIVEPFNKPYVAGQIEVFKSWTLILPYGFSIEFDPNTLLVDEWDRFHGIASNGIPFVLSSKAQAELFNRAESFTDETLTVQGQVLQTQPFYTVSPESLSNAFWQGHYQQPSQPPWDLAEPHPMMDSLMSQLKPPKGRWAVLGSGQGHDAAALAKSGQIAKGFDLSSEAISQANQLYSPLKNLEFIKSDIFQLDPSYHQSFDYIFEHTCYCAIAPDQRTHLIKVWKTLLVERGHLLGIFFVQPKRGGPPFGGSEWELLRLLVKSFDILYWTRCKLSPQWRLGTELIVYAQKK